MGSDFEPTVLYLPDTMAHWPVERVINPHHKEVEAAFDAQFSKFMPHVTELGLEETMRKWDSVLSAAYGLPTATKETLLFGGQYMCFGFMVDAFTDCLPPSVVRDTVALLRNIMQSPPEEVLESNHFFVQFTKEFLASFKKIASPNAQKHLYEGFYGYFDSVRDHAKSREMGDVLTVEKYMANRRGDVGVRPLFAITEASYDIPDDIFSHPVVQEIHIQCIDMTIFDNDLLSYCREYAMYDEAYNLLTIIMHQYDVTLDEAARRVCQMHKVAADRMLHLLDNLPAFPAENEKDVRAYLSGLRFWVGAGVYWAFESGRYFGDKGLEIQSTRLVPLRRGDTEFRPTKLEA